MPVTVSINDLQDDALKRALGMIDALGLVDPAFAGKGDYMVDPRQSGVNVASWLIVAGLLQAHAYEVIGSWQPTTDESVEAFAEAWLSMGGAMSTMKATCMEPLDDDDQEPRPD